MAEPSLLEALVRGYQWPPSGQRGSACVASAWCACVGAEIVRAHGPAARAHVRSPGCQVENMLNRFRHSELELRGPRTNTSMLASVALD
eukprot:8176727-Alexandrium_andersonii.AAC.1